MQVKTCRKQSRNRHQKHGVSHLWNRSRNFLFLIYNGIDIGLYYLKKFTLTYRMIGEEGPDHNKTFLAEVLLNGVSRGMGKGRSKKEAEQFAARSALETLEKE